MNLDQEENALRVANQDVNDAEARIRLLDATSG